MKEQIGKWPYSLTWGQEALCRPHDTDGTQPLSKGCSQQSSEELTEPQMLRQKCRDTKST